ncbi:S8 family serine peptidase [Pseudoalteromonas sp. MMG005]|uniref:S8 family serine peptidase n=1 Tax=Pseudoalteromonas sp. MMG005 TaxID=2822682 RepID=UPI001B3A3B6F|nr:S8 family serine peptidase [Pseudoalteromonas sp. MMG005]MBQ4845154.1 S8 family serine peptidase [Pseudoalteromonas sp. MMG005]
MKNKLALLTCAVSAALAFQASATTDRDYDNRWIDLKYDPLVQYQWNLLNDGTRAGTVAGVDLNLWQTHIWGHLGQGVKVAVIDTGVELSHPDLADNVIIDPNTNENVSGSHGTMVGGIIAAVMNDIGARGVAPSSKVISYANFGGAVDSHAQWKLSHGDDGDINAHTIADEIRIFNQSYGVSQAISIPYEYSQTISAASGEQVLLIDQADRMRVLEQVSTSHILDPREATFVKSAGNGYTGTRVHAFGDNGLIFKGHSIPSNNNFGLPWHNSNVDFEQANYWNLTVSALNADGKLSSYSSVGSNVFLTAPGGNDQGTPGHVTPTLSCELLKLRGELDTNVFNRIACDNVEAIDTLYAISEKYRANYGKDFMLLAHLQENDTQVSAQDKQAISAAFAANAGHLDYLILLQNRNPTISIVGYMASRAEYSYSMNGTSSAAPNTSGAIALLISAAEQQNHSLSARDIRHLLARTATKVDPYYQDILVGDVVGLEGWSQNNAQEKVSYSPYYGFGLIDVDKAAELIRRYAITDLPSALIMTPWHGLETAKNIVISDDAQTVTDTVTIADDLFVEAVQVRLDVDHTRISDLKVELESPSGTRSILMSPHNNLVGRAISQSQGIDVAEDVLYKGYNDHLMLSYKFWNEKSNAVNGEWKLHVTDVSNTDRNFSLRQSNGETVTINNKNNAVSGILKGWSLRVIGHKEKVTKKKSL